MAWDELELQEYAIRFRGKLIEGERKGLIVRLKDSMGNLGIGDIAPLPGFSQESLEQARRDVLEGHFHLPSVNFGIGCAERMLEAAREDRPLFQRTDLIPVSGLLDPRVDPPHAGLFSVVKVKVGRDAPKVEAGYINKLLNSNPSVRLRLDGNLLPSYEKASELLDRIHSPSAIEYFEDPCDELDRWEDLECPVALDEVGRLGSEWVPSNGAALILKPTLLGFKQTYDLAAWGKEVGLEPVISSSFESGIGHAFLAYLASELQHPKTAAGLDPWMWIERSVLHK